MEPLGIDMGWQFRRSLKLPLGFRANFSRRGIGWSAGVKGYRVGVDALKRKYQYISIPGTGIYRRDYFKKLPVTPLSQNFRASKFFWVVLIIVLVLYVVSHM